MNHLTTSKERIKSLFYKADFTQQMLKWCTWISQIIAHQ